MTNFDFLKNIDKDLYTIAGIAEKLYRDEYFEQCMGQTRRFAENAVKRVLGNKAPYDATFDELINTLKDNSKGNAIEKEFIDDLYFLKKAGNKSVHGASVKNDGITALECLRRMFEVAINYAVHRDKTNANLLKMTYDEELLLLGRPKQQKTLQEKYLAVKELFDEKEQQEKLEMQGRTSKNLEKPKPPAPKPSKKQKSTQKIKTETIVPKKKSRGDETKKLKNNTGAKKRQAVQKNKPVGKRRKNSKKAEQHVLPLFLKPVPILVSFLVGAIVLCALALKLKIL